MMTPRARMMMMTNEQTQQQTSNEGTMPQMMIDLNNVPVPNRLMTRLTEWNKIGGQQMIINGAQPEWTSPIAPLLLQQMKQPRQFKGNQIQEQEYQNQLNEELKNGIIKETNSIQVYNPTFIVPRKDGRLKKILDCRRINFFTKHVHFKMDGPEQLRQILQQSDYATILDIKDAFHHIHVQPNLQQFLGFKFRNRSYTYSGLPFGWNLSPFFFSKTLAIAIRAIRSKWKIKIQHYMDDIILIHHSKDTLKQTTQDVIRFLQNLGQRLSPNKCVLIPKMTFQYLGWQFQTASMEVTMTPNRRREMKNKLKTWIQMTNDRQIVTIRSLASLIGDINYLRFQFPQISLWMNSLNNLKTKAVAKGGWEASVKLNKQILGNLQTILIMIKQNRPRQLKDRTPNTTLTTDASEDGWGMTLDHSNEQILDAGQWEGSWYLHSSKLRELAAVLILLRNQQQTLTDWKTKCILLKTDNITTEFVIRKWKAASAILLLVTEIFFLFNNLDITIYTEHLPGLENSTADALSRLSWIGNYQINRILFNEALHQINFLPTLDAFAHKTNKQLKRYCSPQEDNKAIAINARNILWTNELLLLHSPIGLIPKAIQKMIRDQVVAELILPRWCLYKYRTMLPPIQNQVSLGLSEQVLIKGKTMKELSKLLPVIIEMVKINTKTESSNKENLQNKQKTWRKRKAGLIPLANYLKQNNINTSTLLGNKPDVELVNALAWYKDRGGPKFQQRMKNMKMHCGFVLSQFSQMNDINNSSLVKTYSKGQGLSIQSKPRFPTIWNLQILFYYNNTQTPANPEEIQQTAMAIIVAFCAVRMTELVFMKKSEMVDGTHYISLKTQTSKINQVIIHTITFEERSGICCPVKTLRKWIQQRNTDGISEDQI
ncbi:MAG: putative Transposon Tf2-6 polyprotein [Streblomastix strix]|uniref:Putative Transposon Tf2-6 polyprotein n=1 Tax=Streblomastix strix TaxID=222440 RepID=A0A5J4VED1_9EUKA|nr:MAG: putative Transposon Tf2-6 polyprotein [Streblomastix strix]